MPSSTPLSPTRKPMFKPNWTISSNEVEQGCILWLGSVEETIDAQLRRGSTAKPIVNVKTKKLANDGMYEHPILIVSRPAADPSRIYFLPMTSLANKTLEQRYQGRKAPFHRSTFVPLSPAPEHPHFLAGDTRYRRLTLKGGGKVEKATYVNVRELYTMDWRDAQLYWGADVSLRKRWQLDSDSIQSVCYLAGIYTGLRVGRQFIPSLGPLRRDSATGAEESSLMNVASDKKLTTMTTSLGASSTRSSTPTSFNNASLIHTINPYGDKFIQPTTQRSWPASPLLYFDGRYRPSPRCHTFPQYNMQQQQLWLCPST